MFLFIFFLFSLNSLYIIFHEVFLFGLNNMSDEKIVDGKKNRMRCTYFILTVFLDELSAFSEKFRINDDPSRVWSLLL